jgi:hypothetical protein
VSSRTHRAFNAQRDFSNFEAPNYIPAACDHAQCYVGSGLTTPSTRYDLQARPRENGTEEPACSWRQTTFMSLLCWKGSELSAAILQKPRNAATSFCNRLSYLGFMSMSFLIEVWAFLTTVTGGETKRYFLPSPQCMYCWKKKRFGSYFYIHLQGWYRATA